MTEKHLKRSMPTSEKDSARLTHSESDWKSSPLRPLPSEQDTTSQALQKRSTHGENLSKPHTPRIFPSVSATARKVHSSQIWQHA